MEEAEEAQEVEDPTESGGYEDNAPGDSADGDNPAGGVSTNSGPSKEGEHAASSSGEDNDKTIT